MICSPRMIILVPLETTETTANPFRKGPILGGYIKWNNLGTACRNFKNKPILKSSNKAASIESKIKPHKETWNFDATTLWPSIFLVGIDSVQSWKATTKHRATRTRRNEWETYTRKLFRKNTRGGQKVSLVY